MKLLLAFLIFTGALLAQSHSVTITIADTLNPAGTTYNVYRSPGACSATAIAGTPLATGVSVKSYVDSTVTEGSYCYAVTAVVNSLESAQSNQVTAAILPFAPNITITVK